MWVCVGIYEVCVHMCVGVCMGVCVHMCVCVDTRCDEDVHWTDYL